MPASTVPLYVTMLPFSALKLPPVCSIMVGPSWPCCGPGEGDGDGFTAGDGEGDDVVGLGLELGLGLFWGLGEGEGELRCGLGLVGASMPAPGMGGGHWLHVHTCRADVLAGVVIPHTSG
jgi:hypothetical protein